MFLIAVSYLYIYVLFIVNHIQDILHVTLFLHLLIIINKDCIKKIYIYIQVGNKWGNSDHNMVNIEISIVHFFNKMENVMDFAVGFQYR